MKKIIFTSILFMFVFSFKLPLMNSSFYASLLSLLFIFFSVRIEISKTIAIKSAVYNLVTGLVIPLLFFSLVSLFVIVMHSTSDYAYFLSIIKVFAYVLAFIPLVILFIHWFNFDTCISKFMYNIFFLQSIIIALCLFIPEVRDLIKNFQFEDAVEVSERYNGIRGLALAGPQFFALACSYIFILVFMASDFINKKISFKYTILVTIPIFFATFSIGRTALLGIVFYFFIIFTAKLNVIKINRGAIGISFMYAILVIVLGFFAFFVPVLNHLVFDNLIPFAFEFFVKYADTGTFSTTSTDVLKNMYFPLSETTFLFGDGLYLGVDGVGYYMGTDAGYMRPVLFGGIFFFLMLMLFWCFYIFNSLKISYGEYISSIVILLTLLLQYKGEAIIVQPTILATLLPFILLSKRIGK